MMEILGGPFGIVMNGIFRLVPVYGWALLIFTVLTRAVMIPLTIKQTKSTAKMSIVQPQIQEIQKRHAGNRQKINEEMMALYGKVGYNPTAGCLPMILQMVILFGIIDVIFRPMTHILRLSSDVIDSANDITAALPTDIIESLGTRAANAIELTTLNVIDRGYEYYRLYAEAVSSYDLELMREFAHQMHFLGLNLMEIPNIGMLTDIFSGIFNPIILIPILSGLTSILLTLATMGQMSTGAPGMPNMKFMMWMMPIFSTAFTFAIPAGVGIYWIYANVVGYAQAKILKKFYNPKEMAEKHRQEMEELKERERTERKAAKERAKERGDTEDMEALSKKEQNRRKLAIARQRDAEKYGENYNDEDDD